MGRNMCTLVHYKDRSKNWRWVLRAANGRKVATSGEGYRNRKHGVAIAALLLPWIDPVTLRGEFPARRR